MTSCVSATISGTRFRCGPEQHAPVLFFQHMLILLHMSRVTEVCLSPFRFWCLHNVFYVAFAGCLLDRAEVTPGRTFSSCGRTVKSCNGCGWALGTSCEAQPVRVLKSPALGWLCAACMRDRVGRAWCGHDVCDAEADDAIEKRPRELPPPPRLRRNDSPPSPPAPPPAIPETRRRGLQLDGRERSVAVKELCDEGGLCSAGWDCSKCA